MGNLTSGTSDSYKPSPNLQAFYVYDAAHSYDSWGAGLLGPAERPTLDPGSIVLMYDPAVSLQSIASAILHLATKLPRDEMELREAPVVLPVLD